MHWTQAVACVPVIGMLAGAALFNGVTPLVLGMPLLLAWLVACVVLTSAAMALVYLCDPARRTEGHR